MAGAAFLRGAIVRLLAATIAALLPTGAHAAEITAREIRDGLFLFQGSGANVLALSDGESLLVVDGGLEEESADLYAALLETTGANKIGILINTHWHPEQTGLNDEAAADGATIIAHEQSAMYMAHDVTSPDYEQVEALPEEARPDTTTRTGGELTFGGRRVVYGYLPAAHTNGDLYVHFPDYDVLAAGGVVGVDHWPLVDFWNGGFIGGLVRAHEKLSDIAGEETIVVPDLGPTITGAELEAHRDMYQQLFRDLNYLMNKGMGYDDVVALNPLQGREDQFGDPSRFLDGAYRSKMMAYVPD